ncbi:envelope integrity protein Cei [Actinocrispum wychmicini]|uniref:LytR cell envelope-related transcriptional attenuator n=1 Tax=Actinocrispum wychmicini TaxID=1213861 RepID=A0A4R2JE41_9PSEU|nr:envelope integrity protein Cei [Actinocrispum wychmicini]TCO52515.1 LytR cell envelope-related transcriptional attenuator [Actinocrispum wychmicini]
MTAGSLSGGGRAPRYRRRRPIPALVMLVLLGLGATIVWLKVIDNHTKDATASVHCDPPTPATAEPGQPAPPPAPPLGQHVDQNGLDQTLAATPDQIQIRVLNASKQRGEAALVTENLKQLGFSQVGKPDDDPVYPQGSMTCRSQIRFGAQGAPAARTMSLLEPCAELIKDGRQDATVDFVIGKKFDDLQVRTETQQVLKQIVDWSAQHPPQTGGLQSVQGSAGQQIDQALVDSIRKTAC